ncbi:MAG: GFA family protein [Pseudomonadales bacterium]|nr:GFA family protein [Pseudomonadales bacterium]
MTTKHQGTCLCGDVRFELEGDFQSFYLCYCQWCQKDTGSAHAANLFAAASVLTWVSGRGSVRTYRHANTRHSRSFCQNCGSAVPTVAEELGFVVVPAGCLDGAVPIAPTARLFVSRRPEWCQQLEAVRGFDALPE